ncbi:MAG TPA: cardiolipin synthase [Methanomassiliicoccales archaeon]|nr:cardiolipin synthase [Methanomassiliicoccales archaeon]
MAFDLGQVLLPLVIIFDLAAIVYVVFFERRDPGNATVWILALVFMPFLGFVLYLLFGRPYFKQKDFQLKAKGDQERIHQFLNEQKAELARVKGEFAGSEMESILQAADLLLTSNGALVTQGNEVRAFVRGQDKFGALLDAINGAKHHIHMEYYIIENDELGRKIVAALTEKARQGVEVRLLYDAFGNRMPKEGYQMLLEAGGKVAPFYKVLIPAITLRINYHDHRKIAIVDGRIGFLGGFNIGEEYLGKGPLGWWRDTAVEIKGQGVDALQLRFFLDWNYATKENLSFGPAYFPMAKGNGNAYIQIVSGGPDNLWNPIKEEYLKLIALAKRTIYLQTPYFVPDQSVLDALRIAALSGVDVRIMFPDKPDHPFVYWASYSYVGELLDAGVRAYTYNNGFIHAKTVTVDDLVSSIGTANWDIRSFRLNFETNAVIYDREFARQQREIFEEDLKVCTQITSELYKDRSLTIRTKEGVSRLLSSVL